LAAAAVVFLAAVPQLHMWAVRGREWNGSYAGSYGDESIYSAYVNALVAGRPRRNDPFTGRDETPSEPRQESHLSVQFLPAYAVALPARALGITTSTAFIILGLCSAFAATLAIFHLLAHLTGDDRLAAAGAVFVLCFGTLAAWEGMAPFLLGEDPQFFRLLFFRRYQPAATFPLFFVFCAQVWRALTSRDKGRIRRAVAVAAGLLPVFIFSYAYLWTSAAAWLAFLAVAWLLSRPGEWRRVLGLCSAVGATAALALIPYARMLSNRPETMDVRQTFEATHAPDLLHFPVLLGAVTVIMLAFGVLRRALDWREPAFLFALSLAVLPAVVFNQQVLTGRSVQPFHYGVFITNYVVLVALSLAAFLLRRTREAKPVSATFLKRLVLISLLWGVVETVPVTLFNNSDSLDEAVPVARRLNALAGEDGTLPVTNSARLPLVLATRLELNTVLPTYIAQPVLYSTYNLDFPDVSLSEHKERFYKALYYAGVDGRLLYRSLRNETSDRELSRVCRSGTFDHRRIYPILSREYRPITEDEVRDEVRKYEEYAAAFSAEAAAGHELSYVVAPAYEPPDLSNIDRWYERDAGERFGKFILYRVRLRGAKKP